MSLDQLREGLARWDEWDNDHLNIGAAHPFWPLADAARKWLAPPSEAAIEAAAQVIWTALYESKRGEGGTITTKDVRAAVEAYRTAEIGE